MFADDELTQDGFLDGKLSIWQPRKGYRAATDPVFLAASVPAKPGQSVLELGCGVGVASLCLGWRVAGLSLSGVEVQGDYAVLARRNGTKNDLNLQVTECDLAALPATLVQQSFDHVMFNPPYLTADGGTPAADQGRETAFREDTPLAVWIDTAVRRLKPRGVLSVIHLADRLPDILACFDARLSDITVKPIAPRRGQAAGRVVVRARKGGRGAFQLLAPLVVHDGDMHDGDRDSTSHAARAILRDGTALAF